MGEKEYLYEILFKMTFITRPRLENREFRQLTGDSITLSGTTNIVGTLKLKSIPITVTGATNGFVFTYDLAKNAIRLLPQSGGTSTARGNAIVDIITQPSHGFIASSVGKVVGYNGTQYVLVYAAVSQPEPLGIISKVIDSSHFEITYSGYIKGISGGTVSGTSAIFKTGTTYFLSPTLYGYLSDVEPIGIGQVSKPMLVTLTKNDGIVFNWRANVISISGGSFSGFTGGGTIGPAEDGSYADGLFPDFQPSTLIGTAIDRFNEVLKALAPAEGPNLSSLNKTGTGLFAAAKLSFGISRNDIGYANVTNIAGGGSLDINGSYSVTSNRLGATNTASITGVLNSSVAGNSSYQANAVGHGDKGILILSLNGSNLSVLVLSGTTGTTSNANLSVGALSAVTTQSGLPFNVFKYRVGTYTIANSSFVNGFNYLRVLHNRGTDTVQTNYLEFVYDPNANALSYVGTPFISLVSLSGTKFISGVKYHTGGTIQYSAVTANVYRNVYSPGVNSFGYPSRTNINDASTISKSGTGLVTESNSSKNLPALNAGVVNAQNTNLVLLSTHSVNAVRMLGSIGTLGKIDINSTITQPLKTTLTGGLATVTGFLYETTTQSVSTNNENYDGEVNRLQNRDYTALSYANVDGGTYVWSSTQNLISGDAFHNTGLLTIGGAVTYPNSTFLSSSYGITTGNFSTITFAQAGNPNYTAASGTRESSVKFKSTNVATQSTLTFNILYNGSTAFLTNGGTGGTISGNNIKIECMIKRSGGASHGYFNPFASAGNPEGITNTAITPIAGGTSVSCTLSTIPRVGNGDIVIFRIRAASGWADAIQNVQVTNI